MAIPKEVPKRRRRSPVDSSSKRTRKGEKLDSDDTPVRSRKNANGLAQELLESNIVITDSCILKVLRMWKFAANTNRENVRPHGTEFVYSDTLGLVMTRTGKVTATRATLDFPFLFRILAEWIKTWWPSEKKFVFTSINVNANYAARIHRDGNNVGPSVTKSFGEFQEGGALMYWGQDDGHRSLDQLQTCHPEILNTRDALCLFDGNRAHAVQPFFTGERYSLVFFTTSAYPKASIEQLQFLASLGATIPTPETLNHFIGYLSPAKGYDFSGKKQRTIREVCGRETLPTCIAWSKPGLLDIDKNCIDLVFSFILKPKLMSLLASVAKGTSHSCWRESAWAGTIVNTVGLRPGGALAFKLFKIWKRSRAIVASGWEFRNVGFLCGPFFAWRFCASPGNPNQLVSRLPVLPDVKLLFDLAGIRGKVVVGFATHDTLGQIKTGTTPRFRISATFCNRRGGKVFQLNGKSFGPAAPQTSHLQGVVTLTLHPALIRLEAPCSSPVVAQTPEGMAELPTVHCFLTLPAGARGRVKPCWSVARE